MAALTQEQLDSLNGAIAQGALMVKYQDKEVRYRSLDEMLRLRDVMRSELGLTDKGPRRVLASHSKGD